MFLVGHLRANDNALEANVKLRPIITIECMCVIARSEISRLFAVQ